MNLCPAPLAFAKVRTFCSFSLPPNTFHLSASRTDADRLTRTTARPSSERPSGPNAAQYLLRSGRRQRLQSPAVQANLQPDDAIQRLLVGTHLRAVHVNDNTVRVEQEPVVKRAENRNAPSARPTGAASSPATVHLASAASGEAENASDERHDQRDSGISQTEARSLAEVVVTGSHIKGIENSTSPVIVLDHEQIEKSGYSSTQDLFRSLPQNFTSGDASADGIFGNNPNRALNAGRGKWY